MARPAKAGEHWTLNELDAYNIRISTVDTRAFFGISDLPDPVVSPDSVILNHVSPPASLQLSPNDRLFFHYLLETTLGEVSYVNDFTGHLLPVLGLTLLAGRVQFVHRLRPLPFIMSDRWVHAKPTFSLMDRDDYFLLVETETCPRDREEPRLVASAIGAFTADNYRRTRAGLPPMPSKRYIGIVMIRSAPRLYKITITQALVNAVETSQTPAEETIIERFTPPVPNADNFFDEGMVPLENRHICFQCFEAMKALVTV